jgi:hypothetical protein
MLFLNKETSKNSFLILENTFLSISNIDKWLDYHIPSPFQLYIFYSFY